MQRVNAGKGTEEAERLSEDPLECQEPSLGRVSAEPMWQRGLETEVGTLNPRGQSVCPAATTGWNGR